MGKVKNIKKEETKKSQEKKIVNTDEIELREIKSLTDDYIVDDETYFADQMYLTNSMLKSLMYGSTFDLNNYLESERKETESLLVGSAFHCYLLEPEEFDKRYVFAPKFDRRTKAGKQQYAEFEEAIEGKKAIPDTYMEAFNTLVDRIKKHTYASHMVFGGVETESIKFWEDVDTGVKCKGKIDVEGKDYIVDIKTTSKGVDIKSFREFAEKYYIANQAAFYCNGTQKKKFFFIMCQLKAPYNIAIYQMSPDAIKYGNTIIKATMGLYKEWLDSDKTLEHYTNGEQIIVV